jgi:hypothetical protein
MFDIQRLLKKLRPSSDQTEVMRYLVIGPCHEYSIEGLLGVSRFDIGELKAPGVGFEPTRPFRLRSIRSYTCAFGGLCKVNVSFVFAHYTRTPYRIQSSIVRRQLILD